MATTGKKPYKIRYDKVEEGREKLRKAQCLDGTADQKLTFLFADVKSINDGWTFKEICLILHDDKTETDKDTGKEIPDFYNYMQTRQELKDYRKKQNLEGVIIYCLYDKKTGLEIYYNIPTLELLEKIEKKNEKIIKGIKENMNNAKKYLKLPASIKKQTTKLLQRRLRQQIIEKIQREQAAKRKKEVEQIYA